MKFVRLGIRIMILSMLEVTNYGYTFYHAHDDIKNMTPYHVDYVYEVIEDMLGGRK